MLRALRSPNYRLFFGGQIVSLTGTWMTTTAMGWLVYRLTGSAMMLGAVAFAGQLPVLFTPLAGIFVDRHGRRRILIATQFFSMVQSLALAALVLTGRVTIGWILVLAAFQGLVNAFDMPCRQAFVVEMLENRRDLSNAIALNSSMFNFARLLGPALGGLVISVAGEGFCFLIDGVSYGAVIASLAAMKLSARAQAPSPVTGPAAQLREAWEYVSGSRPARSLLALLGATSLVGASYTVLMPAFAGGVLGGGSHTLGFLMASAGLGALAGALWLASRRSVLGLGRAIVRAGLLFAAGVAAFSFTRSPWAAAPALVVAGFGFMVQMASCNTILQTIVPDDKRGRVMGFFVLAAVGTAPFGSLFSGFISEKIGLPRTLLFSSAVCAAASLWFSSRLPAIRETVRPIYRKLGIMPEVAAGLETAAGAAEASKE